VRGETAVHGCAGRVANGINTVHLSFVCERTRHALIGARPRIPAEQISDPVLAASLGIPAGLQFRTKGQLAIDICTDAYADGVEFDFACGDEVYGNCTQLREFLEQHQQAYVLRVASSFMLVTALPRSLPVTRRPGRLPDPAMSRHQRTRQHVEYALAHRPGAQVWQRSGSRHEK
jgi:SRSO17 transposase